MRRIAVLLLALSGIVTLVPASADAIPPGVVPGPGSITGTVTDTSGAPIPGVEVNDSFGFAVATTDVDGTYLLENLFPGEEVVVLARDRSGFHEPGQSAPVVVSDIDTVVADITLADASPQITGTVLDTDGAPVAGATVVDQNFSVGSARTNAQGRFGMTGFAEGPNGVDVFAPADRPELANGSATFDVIDGVAVDLTVTLPRLPTVDVTVTADGAPVAGSVVLLWSTAPFGGVVSSALADDTGLATVPVFSDGEYFLEVQSPTPDLAGEYVPDSVTRAGAARLTVAGEVHIPVAVDLERAAVITGTVTFPDGSPGSAFDVTARPAGSPDQSFPDLPPCNLPGELDPPGVFRVGCLHPSVDYIVKAFGVGAADNEYYLDSQSATNATPIPVEPGEVVSGIDIQLDPLTPAPELLGLSQQFFLAGTTTPGVRVFGRNFPSDPHALELTSFGFSFDLPIDFEVTAVPTPSEAIVTVTVGDGSVGDIPVPRSISLSRSTGGVAFCDSCLYLGDSTTLAATLSGRVTDSRGRGVANVPVVLANSAGGQRTSVSGPDGRWTAQALSPGSYTVRFEGTEALAGQWWRGKTKQSEATSIDLAPGTTRTGINATLTRRGPITTTSATPKRQPPEVSFDLVGTGLSPITGGFRVSLDGPFGPEALQATSVGAERLRVSGFASPGTYDVRTEWTGDDGATRSTVCGGCLIVYELLEVFPFDTTTIARGTTATVSYFGFGLVDITKVTVSGTGVSVRGFETTAGNTIDIRLNARSNAPLGSRVVTITRADGSTATVPLDVVPS